ncbi:ABC transporter ATP-binding protein [Brevibacterium samyangense]|uniref:ABC transporter ATP-binding protein n=1 Tax=Brevibacterium samyangense TaxID=366888 RepID=A0ABN2TMY0_9MICO
MSTRTPAAIEIRDLVKTFGRTTALHGVDLAVPRGSVVGVIGPNGAGKSTTMRVLLDIIRPSSGDVRVLGEDPRRGGPHLRRRIGYLPGEFVLGDRVTARRLLTHFCRLAAPHAVRRIDPMAERLGLDPDRPIRSLSKGNKQKVGLVQAFIHHPELLILDEPTSGLDPILQREFLAMVHEAQAAGTTVFLSSHVLSEVESVAQTAAVLRSGRVVAEAPVAELRTRAGHELTARLAHVSAERVGASAARHIPDAVLDLEPVEDGRLLLRGRVPGEHEAAEVLAFLREFTVEDFTFRPRNLESAVLELYADGDSEDGSDGGSAGDSVDGTCSDRESPRCTTVVP